MSNADYFRQIRLLPEDLPRVLPYRELMFKRIKRRIKLKKKRHENPSQKIAGKKDQQYLVDVPSQELVENLHRSHAAEQISFETEAYDVYEGAKSESDPKEVMLEERPAIYNKLPTLKLVTEEQSTVDDYSDEQVSHLILDFGTVNKTPLLELNLSPNPRNIVHYEEPIQSRDRELPRESDYNELKSLKLYASNRHDQLIKQKSPTVTSKKVYLVKGVRQRENFEDIKGEAYQEYFTRKKQNYDQNQMQEQEHQNSHRRLKNIPTKAAGSRLDDLREKLKSLESRSSSLSQRITTLITDREGKKKVDYAQLMARVKGTAAIANGQPKKSIRANALSVQRYELQHNRGDSAKLSSPSSQDYPLRTAKFRNRDPAQAVNLYRDH